MSAEAKTPVSGRFNIWTMRLLAAVGVLACLAVIAIALAVFGLSRIGGGGAPAKVEAAATHEVFTIGDVATVRGTKLISMDVQASADGGSLSSARAGGDRRNVVLLDTLTGNNRRILPDNNHLISDFRFLPNDGDDQFRDSAAASTGDKGDKAIAPVWYMAVIDQAGETHLQNVMLGVIASQRQAVVLSGIDGIDAAWAPDASHIALIVRDHRKLFYRLIDTASFKVSASHAIAID